MFRSCEVLRNMPGHDERVTTCDKFRESLLSALRPRVRHDVTTANVSPLHEYLYVYDKLLKRDEFEEEYTKARPESLKGLWASYQHGDAFIPWYSSYLSSLVQFLCDEFEQMKTLFGDVRAPVLLCSMMKHALSPIQHTLSDTLKKLNHADTVVEAYLLSDKAAGRLSAYLEGTDQQALYEALDCYFGGFVHFLDAYVDLESSSLKADLDASLEEVVFKSLESESDEFSDPDRDALQVLESFSERLLRTADGSYIPINMSIKRSVKYMNGLKVKPILRSLATSLAQFVKLLSGKIDEMRIALGFELDLRYTGDKLTGEDVKFASAKIWFLKLKDSGSDVNSASGGRLLLPCVLRLLQAVGRLVQRVAQLDEETGLALYTLYTIMFKDTALERSYSQNDLAAGVPSLGAQLCGLLLQQDSTAAAELRGYLSSLAKNPGQTSVHLSAGPGVFSSVMPSITKLRSSAGSLLFDLCTALPRKLLVDVSSEDSWSVGRLASGSDAETASFRADDNILPQQFFTQVEPPALPSTHSLGGITNSKYLLPPPTHTLIHTRTPLCRLESTYYPLYRSWKPSPPAVPCPTC